MSRRKLLMARERLNSLRDFHRSTIGVYFSSFFAQSLTYLPARVVNWSYIFEGPEKGRKPALQMLSKNERPGFHQWSGAIFSYSRAILFLLVSLPFDYYSTAILTYLGAIFLHNFIEDTNLNSSIIINSSMQPNSYEFRKKKNEITQEALSKTNLKLWS